MSVHHCRCALLIVEPSLNFAVRCVFQRPPPGQESQENPMKSGCSTRSEETAVREPISHVELYKRLVAKGMYNSTKVSNIKATSQGVFMETNGQELGANGPGTFICSFCGIMFSAEGG